MGINFPNFPSIGDLHPTPPQAGVPQYRWDGTAWVAQSQDQLAFVKRTGDTMSGALTLPADPAAALQAATKQYVDAKSSLYISDNPPVGPPDGSMWWDSDNGLLYIRYNDGAGPAQWVQAVATPAIDSSVFVNKAGDTMGGALTLPGDPAAALQAAPKQYVDAVRAYAAPYDAFAYSGMQINGGMEVSQENGGGGITIPTGSSKYIVDGWFGTSVGSQAIVSGHSSTLPPGYAKSIQFYASTANASPAVGDRGLLIQGIEGYRISRLAFGTASAKPVTIGFWVYSSTTGLFSGSLRNGGENRSYVFSYTISAALTWEYKTVTIPGDTAGTWAKDQTLGAELTFTFLAGGTYLTAAGAWVAGNYVGVTGTTNLLKNTTDYVMLTGVVILPGTQAPTAAQSPLIMRPYDQELMTCQRYYETRRYNPSGTELASWYQQANTYYFIWDFSVPKRANATYALVTGSYAGGPPTTYVSSERVLFTSATAFAALGTAGNICCSADARL